MTAQRILVTVGSDHHTYERLIRWIDDWLDEQPTRVVDCVMQRGAAAAPRNGVSHDYLSHDELMRLLADADVVVTQGGPTGIIESRRRGIRPIAVPRLAALGEHVDNHQVAFCTQLAAVGDVVLAQSRVELCRALDAALQNPGIYRIEPSEAKVAVSETVRRFELLAAGLLHERRRSLFSRSQRR